MKWGSVDFLVQNKCHCACGSFPLHMGLSNYRCPSFAAAGISGCGGKRFAVTFCILISLQVCLFSWWQSCRNFFIVLVFSHGSFGWALILVVHSKQEPASSMALSWCWSLPRRSLTNAGLVGEETQTKYFSELNLQWERSFPLITVC